MKTPIPIFLVGPENWEASNVFNPNAFPEYARGIVFSCIDCLSMLIFSANQVGPNIESDRVEFLKGLQTNKAFEGFTPDTNKPIVIVYHNAKFLAAFHLVLYSIKSFLDVYTQLVTKLIDPNAGIFGFNEGNVNGTKIKGGRLINWLIKSAPNTYTNSTVLALTIQENVSSWIEEAVNWRDNLIHHGELPNLRPMMVLPQYELHKIKLNDIFPPQTPDGGDVITYCEKTKKNMYRFIIETFKLLPGIDFSLVNLDAINK